jgi:IclR family transcriptional regulator, pca regulon regulatory protein
VLGIAEIARELQMSRSTTHRYVSTLHALDYLEQAASRKYRLSPRVTGLGMSTISSISLQEHARAYLTELRRHATGTVSLAVLDGTAVLYIEQARSLQGHSHATIARTGARLPIHCTATGKLLLANLPACDQRELIDAIELKRRGPNTITSKRALRQNLATVLETNLATDNEEQTRNLYSIAAAIRDQTHQVIAAIEIATPSRTITLQQLHHALGPHLITTANHISTRLGYRRADETRR